MTFDPDPQNFAQFPLHYVSYAPAKFAAVASTNGLGGDAFTRNVMDGQMNDGRTDRRTMDRLGEKLIYAFLRKNWYNQHI